MLLDKLTVYLYDNPIGWLERDHNNKMTFRYHKEAAFAISLSLPLKEKTFDDKNCRKYFRGLFPESTDVLEALCQQLGTYPKDVFGLLAAYGKECMGAIAFCAAGEILMDSQNHLIHAHVVKGHFKIQQSNCMALHSSNDKKMAVCLIDKKIALVESGRPTTHLLKMSEFNRIINQYFCLRLAMTLGIHCVNAKLVSLAKEPGLLVERYDRVIVDVHYVKYFHQEDFLQALGYFASHKYEWDNGPNLEECFLLLSKTIVPAIARLQLVKRVIFNYLIGNTQAHPKNISLVYYAIAKPMLAPLHNAIATIDDTQMMAMKIGNSYTLETVSMEDWQIFCRKIKFSFCIFKQLFREAIHIFLIQADKQRAELHAAKWDVKEIDKIIKAMKHRCERYSDYQDVGGGLRVVPKKGRHGGRPLRFRKS